MTSRTTAPASQRSRRPIAPRRARRSVGWQSTLAVAVPLLCVYGQFLAYGGNTALLAALGGFAQAVAAGVVYLMLRPATDLWRRALPVLVPLLAALLWAALPALFPLLVRVMTLRPAPDAFLPEFARLCALLAMLAAGMMIGSRPLLTRRTFDLLLALGLVYLLVSLSVRQSDPFSLWASPAGPRLRFSGTILNANAAACSFGILAVVAMGRLQEAWRQAAGGWTLRIGIIAQMSAMVILLAFGAAALTGSRFTLIATVLLLAVMMWRESPDADAAPRSGVWRYRRILTGATAAALLLVVLAMAGQAVTGRLPGLFEDVSDRSLAMSHYLALANASPWFGYGLGSFADLNLATLDAGVSALWNFGAAHNAPIQAALEAGWPFVILVTIAIAVVVGDIWRAQRAGAIDALTRALVATVALIFACAMVDITLSVPALAALAALLSGMVVGRLRRSTWDAAPIVGQAARHMPA